MESIQKQNEKEQRQEHSREDWEQMGNEEKTSQLEMRLQMMIIKEKNFQ